MPDFYKSRWPINEPTKCSEQLPEGKYRFAHECKLNEASLLSRQYPRGLARMQDSPQSSQP